MDAEHGVSARNHKPVPLVPAFYPWHHVQHFQFHAAIGQGRFHDNDRLYRGRRGLGLGFSGRRCSRICGTDCLPCVYCRYPGERRPSFRAGTVRRGGASDGPEANPRASEVGLQASRNLGYSNFYGVFVHYPARCQRLGSAVFAEAKGIFTGAGHFNHWPGRGFWRSRQPCGRMVVGLRF